MIMGCQLQHFQDKTLRTDGTKMYRKKITILSNKNILRETIPLRKIIYLKKVFESFSLSQPRPPRVIHTQRTHKIEQNLTQENSRSIKYIQKYICIYIYVYIRDKGIYKKPTLYKRGQGLGGGEGFSSSVEAGTSTEGEMFSFSLEAASGGGQAGGFNSVTLDSLTREHLT